jgi:hypothetical protein
LCPVNDSTGEVVDTKIDTRKGALLDQTGDGLVTLECLTDKGLVVTLGTDALFVQLFDDLKLSLNQLEDIGVVIVFDIIKVQSFGFVFFLHGCEYISCENLLELLVTVVDTELFESVDGEGFESKDIQKTNQTIINIFTAGVVIFGTRDVVNGTDQLQKDLGINLLGKGIGGFLGNVILQGDLVFFTTGLDGMFREGQFEGT